MKVVNEIAEMALMDGIINFIHSKKQKLLLVVQSTKNMSIDKVPFKYEENIY